MAAGVANSMYGTGKSRVAPVPSRATLALDPEFSARRLSWPDQRTFRRRGGLDRIGDAEKTRAEPVQGGASSLQDLQDAWGDLGGFTRPGLILAVGGANLDIRARIAGRVMSASSNPGRRHRRPGRRRTQHRARPRSAGRTGVAAQRRRRRRARRAIALGLRGGRHRLPPCPAHSRANGHPHRDARIRRRTRHRRIAHDCRGPVAALRDRGGGAHDRRGGGRRGRHHISSETLLALGQRAERHSVPLVIEPVSVAKSARIRPLIAAGLPIALITPTATNSAR